MYKIIDQIKDMQFLLTAPVVSIDIETQTTPNGPAADLGDSFGLSYNADVIAIALNAGPDFPTAVFLDTHLYTPEQTAELRNFLIAVLCRDVLIVGHNVLFDLRSLGGHYDFELPIETRVWDTMVMTRKLLLIPVESSKYMKFGLLHVAKSWGDMLNADEEKFVEFMKGQRGNLGEFMDADAEMPEEPSDTVEHPMLTAAKHHNPMSYSNEDLYVAAVVEDPSKLKKTQRKIIVDHYNRTRKHPELKDLPSDHPVWGFGGGFNPKKLDEISRRLVEKYVASDAHYAYLIYQRQIQFAVEVGSCGPKRTVSPMKNVNVPYWKELPGLLIEWTQQLAMQANLAIRGVAVDLNYLAQRIDETREKALELAPKLLFESDPTDPYPDFRNIVSQLIYYRMVLDAMRDGQTYSEPKGWVNWKKINLDPTMIADALTFPGTDDYELKMAWAKWLLSIDVTGTRDTIIKKSNPPDSRVVPHLDLQKFVQQQCFDDSLVGGYLAFLKARWYEVYFTARVNKTPLEWVSSDHFKPYFVFAVAGWPLYSSADFKYELSLGTKKFQQLRNQYEQEGTNFDLQALAIKMDAYSCGKPALEWIFSHLEDSDGNPLPNISEEYRKAEPKLRSYLDLISTWATHRRMVEYWLHAQRDGRIHSILSPGTATGRDSSTLPNLQNIRMKDFKGVFVGKPGYTPVEVDASNAELRMQAMRSEDDNFAYEVMAGDLHTKMMEMYWPEEVAHLRAIGDYDGLKELRNLGKKATFAGNYGAGPKKQAFLIKKDAAAANAIMERSKQNFPKVYAKKKELEENSLTRVRRGELPAFTRGWHGERYMVDTFDGRLQGYTIWNYQLQGGVASFVHTAMTQIEHHLKRKGYKSRLILSIHDSLVIELANDEYETDLLQEILQIFCNQIPSNLLNKTVPHVYFASEYCPQNRFKWGYRVGQDYPFPDDEFINPWGRFKLKDYLSEKDQAKPRKAWAAPTWLGPVHQGWTLDAAIAEAKAEREAQRRLEQEGKVAEVQRPALPVSADNWLQEFSERAQRLLTPTAIQTTTGTTPVISLEQQFQVMQILKERGHGQLLQEQQAALVEMADWLQSKANDLRAFIKDSDDPEPMAVK